MRKISLLYSTTYSCACAALHIQAKTCHDRLRTNIIYEPVAYTDLPYMGTVVARLSKKEPRAYLGRLGVGLYILTSVIIRLAVVASRLSNYSTGKNVLNVLQYLYYKIVKRDRVF